MSRRPPLWRRLLLALALSGLRIAARLLLLLALTALVAVLPRLTLSGLALTGLTLASLLHGAHAVFVSFRRRSRAGSSGSPWRTRGCAPASAPARLLGGQALEQGAQVVGVLLFLR